MRTIATIILFLSVVFGTTAQEYILSTPTGKIYGELLMPEGDTPCPVVLIIAGSGPTNMDGNSLGTDYKSNSLRYLAEELAKRGIATLRYDKRGIGKSREAQANEENLRFDDVSYQYFGGRSSFGIGHQSEPEEGNTRRYGGSSFKSHSELAAHRETYGFLSFKIEGTSYYIAINTFYA